MNLLRYVEKLRKLSEPMKVSVVGIITGDTCRAASGTVGMSRLDFYLGSIAEALEPY